MWPHDILQTVRPKRLLFKQMSVLQNNEKYISIKLGIVETKATYVEYRIPNKFLRVAGWKVRNK